MTEGGAHFGVAGKQAHVVLLRENENSPQTFVTSRGVLSIAYLCLSLSCICFMSFTSCVLHMFCPSVHVRCSAPRFGSKRIRSN